MGVVTQSAAGKVEGYFEMAAVRLPGCPKCHSPHPLAVKTAEDKTRCVNPECDEPPAKPDSGRFESADPAAGKAEKRSAIANLLSILGGSTNG